MKEEEENNNYSSEINADISHPRMSESGLINKGCSSYILPSNRDRNLYKKFELFLSKNKFHLNNNYDKNNAQIFLKEKNQFLADIDLDDHIEGEEDITLIENGNSSYIKNHINANIKKNNINKINNNVNKNNKYNNNNHTNNINKANKQENFKVNVNENSFEGGNTGCPPGSLFDTGKADLLCLLLGMTNK